jgi:hypothetical protein
MAAITDTIADLTSHWFTEALRETSTASSDTTVTAAQCIPFGVGHTARLVRAQLAYADGSGPATAIVKQPTDDESRRELAVGMGFYRAEVRFYEEVVPRADVAFPRVLECAGGGDQPLHPRARRPLGESRAGGHAGWVDPGADRVDTARARAAPGALWDNPWNYERKWLSDATGTRRFYEAAHPNVDRFLARFGNVLECEQVHLVRRVAPNGGASHVSHEQ